MVNAGEIEREEALRQEEEMQRTYMDGIPALLEKKIGLTQKEAMRFLSLKM
jgi:hypothetical protein